MDRERVVLTPRLVVAALIYFAGKAALIYTGYAILLDIFLTEWPDEEPLILGVLQVATAVAFVLYAVKPLLELLVFRQDSE